MNQSMTLFQFENGAGPAKSLLAAGIDAALGEGIRSSYGVVSIKAGKFRIKYKGVEHVIQKVDPDTGQPGPVSNIEIVIVKANPFLNKSYYIGKYAEGSNSPPDCYSLDGKLPSAQIPKPVFSNCTMCPKNQYGSLVSETGVKQKACADSKKLAVVPLGDLRNEQMGGPMLLKVPPASLKDLSSLADAMKARGYPYNSVAVRVSFDMDASFPKLKFNAIRPLTEAEAEVVLDLFHGDGVAAVLSDNDAVLDVPVAPVEKHSQFEQEPAPVPVTPATMASQNRAADEVPAARQPGPGEVPAARQPGPGEVPAARQPGPGEVPAGTSAPAPVETLPFMAPPLAPMPPGMHGAVVQPLSAASTAQPPAQLFQPPRGPGRPRKAPAAEAPAPVIVAPTVEPVGSTLHEDINSILAGLSAFTGK